MNRNSVVLRGLLAIAAAATWGCSDRSVQETVDFEAFDQAFPDSRVDFPEGDAELVRLFERFQTKNSWHFEEWFIRDYFDDMRDGFFVDVGASRYKAGSNTYYLDTALGWSGIAIDAQDEFRADYEKHRPRTRYFTYYVSDHSTGKKDFFVTEKKGMASGVIKNPLAGEVTETIQVPEITLDDLLDREGVTEIDLFTMDIEQAEPAALRGFDIQRFRPRLVCIEVVHATQEFIEDYFAKNGYVKLELCSRVDSHNSYYVPADSSQ